MPATAPAALPPITINITNNNNGNNSNTNTQTNTAPVTVSTPVTTTTTTTNTVATEAAPAAIAAPGLVPRGVVERYELRHDARSQRLVFVGATHALDGHGGEGLRASFDLLGHGHFTLGVAASLDPSARGGGRERGGGGRDGQRGAEVSGSVVGYVAYTSSLGPLSVRAQLGLGLGTSQQSSNHGERRDDETNGNATTAARSTTGQPTMTEQPRGREGRSGDLGPRAEAALLVGLPLGRHLSVAAGPVLSSTSFDHLGGGHGHDAPVDISVVAGIGYRF